MNNEMKMMVNVIIDEMGRMEGRINKRFEILENRFNDIENRMESMWHDINACKLEKGTLDGSRIWNCE